MVEPRQRAVRADRPGARILGRVAAVVATVLVPLLLVASGRPGVLDPGPRPAASAPAPGPSLPACTGGVLQVVAHQDDDLFFMSPDLLDDLRLRPDRCVRTIYLTAGDAGKGADYWQAREAGMQAAYAKAAQVDNSWQEHTLVVGGHPLPVRTLVGRPSVSLVYLRLPDGFPSGDGTDRYGHQSLIRLLAGRIGTITAVDGSATYTAAGLRDELVALMDGAGPALIRTTDYVHPLGDGDHADHHAAAWLARDASRLAHVDHTILSYEGYPSQQRPRNIARDDVLLKKDIYDTYQAIALPGEPMWRPGFLYRQYVVDRATLEAVPNEPPFPTASAGSAVSARSAVTALATARPYRPGPGRD
ncbi:PIG-L family deacetylase [Raineyella sp.]|uniref:PIG-L family deacetylase n=1 Tax=Raineyella sp. TaxID=1911550 RepID=UPI002B1F06F4|nr:PIG-L family deacetylase [Raineyella sp.]MEA5153642.1 PIG-L family deacetylase [Raineyella sp.]